jgi:hypothetical protein
MRLLWGDKEWVRSDLGVAIIGWLLTLFVRRRAIRSKLIPFPPGRPKNTSRRRL